MRSTDDILADALQKMGRILLKAGKEIEEKAKSDQSPKRLEKPIRAYSQRQLVEYVRNEVCTYMGISITELGKKTRRPPIPLARHAFWFIIREVTDLSLPAIGRLMAEKYVPSTRFDHTTVRSGIHRIKALTENRPDEYRWILQILAEAKMKATIGPPSD